MADCWKIVELVKRSIQPSAILVLYIDNTPHWWWTIDDEWWWCAHHFNPPPIDPLWKSNRLPILIRIPSPYSPHCFSNQFRNLHTTVVAIINSYKIQLPPFRSQLASVAYFQRGYLFARKDLFQLPFFAATTSWRLLLLLLLLLLAQN